MGHRTTYLGGDIFEAYGSEEGIMGHRRREDVAALVDFFRNNEPPPSNKMSTQGEERGRSGLLRKGRPRHKSLGRISHPIRLPDSAVSGTTIGGHRHIAISIPIEAHPLGDSPRSQYPVVPTEENIPPVPAVNGIRTIKNENGVVTVLRAVANTSGVEVPPSPLASHPPFSPGFISKFPTPPKSRPQSPMRPVSKRESVVYLNKPLPPVGDRRPSSRNRPASASGGRSLNRSSAVIDGEFSRAAYPIRGSSMAAARFAHKQAGSIDGILYGHEGAVQARSMSQRLTTSRDGPPISLKRQSLMLTKSTPSLQAEFLESEKRQMKKRSMIQLVTSDPPVVTEPVITEPEQSLSHTKSMSRKEKVRDKRRRDMEAARLARERKQEEADKASKDEKTTSQPSLCPIMVVADFNPDEPSITPPLEAKETAAAPVPSSPQPSHLDLDEPKRISYAGNPTPPQSRNSSPAQKYGFEDRTSLGRRREWSLIRQQEQKNREMVTSLRSSGSLRPLSHESIQEEGDPEMDIIRLYEAYRDHRMLEMDRRLRRLERNGDVWIRALIPMIDDVNQTMDNINQRNEESYSREWASDDGLGPLRPVHDRERRPLGRTSSSSAAQQRPRPSKARRARAASWDNSQDDIVEDLTGLGAMEPMMRDLVSQSKHRQQPAGSRRSVPAV